MAYDAKRYRTRTTVFAKPAVLHARPILSSVASQIKDNKASIPFCTRPDVPTAPPPPKRFPTSHSRSEVEFGRIKARADKSHHSMSKFYDIRRHVIQQEKCPMRKLPNPPLIQKPTQKVPELNKRLFVRGVSMSNAQPPPYKLRVTRSGEGPINGNFVIPEPSSNFPNRHAGGHRVKPNPGYPDMPCYRIIQCDGNNVNKALDKRLFGQTVNGKDDEMFVKNIRQLLTGARKCQKPTQLFHSSPVKGILKSSSQSTFQGEDGVIPNSSHPSNSPTSTKSHKRVQFQNDVVPCNSFEEYVNTVLDKTAQRIQSHIPYGLHETGECADRKSLLYQDKSKNKRNGYAHDKNSKDVAPPAANGIPSKDKTDLGQYFQNEIVHCIQLDDPQDDDRYTPLKRNKNIVNKHDQSQRNQSPPPCDVQHASWPDLLTSGPTLDPHNSFETDEKIGNMTKPPELPRQTSSKSRPEIDQIREGNRTTDPVSTTLIADRHQEVCNESQIKINVSVTDFKAAQTVTEHREEDKTTESPRLCLKQFTHTDRDRTPTKITEKCLAEEPQKEKDGDIAPLKCAVQNLPLLEEKRPSLILRASSPRAPTICGPDKTWRILQWLREVESCLSKEPQHELPRSEFPHRQSQQIQLDQIYCTDN